ncbi:hypothetical protein NDU88_000909 [Pleurodeles waltl]|uniref:Uncharacterized protein n=1 Tax=Pleurodeles waltl TaxID=8319 RepID=A0AAV7S715_PLEWA|nr:hypothetical protein NDU88_000909 [Pleurodeles waltl]
MLMLTQSTPDDNGCPTVLSDSETRSNVKQLTPLHNAILLTLPRGTPLMHDLFVTDLDNGVYDTGDEFAENEDVQDAC